MRLPPTVERLAAAKVNLTLHVTGRRADGYHLLDSLVMFADLGDRVAVSLASEGSLVVEGPEAEGVPRDGANSALRAAELAGVPVAIRLEKHLPAAAGIGGGSADAAAVLQAIAELTGRPPPRGVERLGADVPVCLLGAAARMRGIGERVQSLALPVLDAVLVNPRRPVSTAAVFAALEPAERAGMGEVPRGSAGALIDWLAGQRNDLEEVARRLEPAVVEALAALRAQEGCRLARMSGSGATCFGLCDSEADAVRVAARMAAAHPGWWVRAVRLS